MTENEFRAYIERRIRRIAAAEHRSEVIYIQADRLDVWLGMAFLVRQLRRRAAWYSDNAKREQDNLEQLEKLWAERQQTRRADEAVQTGEQVRVLFRLVNSKTESIAAHAVAELRRIGASFDWAHFDARNS
jgi:hypothetical protein